MVVPRSAGQLLCYAQDITCGDVEGLESFLVARTSRLARTERGSDERQTARSVRAAVMYLVGTLQHRLSLLDPDRETDPMLRLEIRISWNALAALASPWQGQDEYDGERWRTVKYWDMEHESEVEGLLADAVSKSRQRDDSSNSDGG